MTFPEAQARTREATALLASAPPPGAQDRVPSQAVFDFPGLEWLSSEENEGLVRGLRMVRWRGEKIQVGDSSWSPRR